MSHPTVHIINHTHWDREWFLSCVYTTHWIPTLIDRLVEISAENPEFRYLLDGQTLIIEDLLKVYPEYRPKVVKLVQDGNLTIGPYYCQPDWKLTTGESLFRNLEFGQKDAAQLSGTTPVAWLVDTFGHISQAPQIHKQFGIESAFVWRGVPALEPYFIWQGADGTQAFAVDLFGGYRNLYGVTHAPDVALIRLDSEIEKLSPYYPTADIPLFDGYDLEDNPEDSLTFLQSLNPSTEWQLVEATPHTFVNAVRPKLDSLPILEGELNSGKFGAVFPGVYSARSYTRVMSRDCANLVYRWAEPLAAMAWANGREFNAELYEGWCRLLLQNDVHDVTCGVSIDQVHEKAEDIYHNVHKQAQADIEASLAAVLQDFAAGTYAVSANPFNERIQAELIDGRMVDGQSRGIGVFPVDISPAGQPEPPSTVESSSACQNDHYSVSISADGSIVMGDGRLGYFVVYSEHGDAYSDETGDEIGRLTLTTPVTETQTGRGRMVQFGCGFTNGTITISADVTVYLDAGELVRWEIELDSRGSEFRVEMVFESGLSGGVAAGMQYDVVDRPFVDTDLLPLDTGDKAKIFMGQRELNEVRSFPFHDFVSTYEGENAAVVFAKGLNSYRAYDDGRLQITLRRSVEWVTRPQLVNRSGDAGPFFYVPDARCERVVKHELAFAAGQYSPHSMRVQGLNAAYQNPPLIVDWHGQGSKTEMVFWQRDLPLSSMRVVNDQIVTRSYNPTDAQVDGVAAKKIVTDSMDCQRQPAAETSADMLLTVHNPAVCRSGVNQGLPDPTKIEKLREKIAQSKADKEAAEAELVHATGRDLHLAQHQVYIHHREMLEYTLSARLNDIKLAMNGELTKAYLYDPDPQVVKIGWELNQLRIKRRIYDYVAAALQD